MVLADMLKPLARLPEVVIVDRDGAAFAQAFPDAIVLDREHLCIRRDLLCRSLSPRTARLPRLFLLAASLLGRLPQVQTDREAAMVAIGLIDHSELSHRIRQLRHMLAPFGLGVEHIRGGPIVICAPRPEPAAYAAPEPRRAA